VPKKVLRYLPIAPRLQKLYMTRGNAKHMRWHKEGVREKPGIMVHPADGEDWKQFDQKYSEFASEIRNVRLGLSTNGFMPFNSSAAPYSCWPVFMFPYNLPPGLLMKEETMFLTLLLPGPKHPGRDIDICLEPLIDELKTLWSNGIQTYDVLRKKNFIMKVVLMWTVSDFPAFEMLSGWGTHGRLGCPRCMGNTKAFRLFHGGKASWFDCHRCFLPLNHKFRQDKKKFLKNRVENDPPPPMLTGKELLEEVNKLPSIRWGRNAPTSQITGYGKTHHWQKKSIF
jgi:Transposase family tnp2